jgi:anti-sigma regulatory factor (Ser/Thr protein kinase)
MSQRPSTGETLSYLILAPLPSAAFWARRYTEAALGAWQLQQEDIETAELCVSELVTNSIKFAGSPSADTAYSLAAEVEPMSVVLRHRSDTLIIEVCDPDPTPPVLTEFDLNAEGGRGLMLVRALSKEWNYYLPPSGGKVVYCVIIARRLENDQSD